MTREFVFETNTQILFEQGFENDVMSVNTLDRDADGKESSWPGRHPFYSIPEGPVLLEMELSDSTPGPTFVILVEDPDIGVLARFMYGMRGQGNTPLIYQEFAILGGQKIRQMVNPTHTFIGLLTRFRPPTPEDLIVRITALGIPGRPPSSMVRGELIQRESVQ